MFLYKLRLRFKIILHLKCTNLLILAYLSQYLLVAFRSSYGFTTVAKALVNEFKENNNWQKIVRRIKAWLVILWVFETQMYRYIFDKCEVSPSGLHIRNWASPFYCALLLFDRNHLSFWLYSLLRMFCVIICIPREIC